jgi:hypothetical protein
MRQMSNSGNQSYLKNPTNVRIVAMMSTAIAFLYLQWRKNGAFMFRG